MQISLTGSTGPANAPTEAGLEGGIGARARLLASAKHTMAEVGFEQSSLGTIAHAAGVSETEVQHSFPDKTALLEAVFNNAWDPLNSRIADIVMASLDARQAWMGVLAALLHVMDRDVDLARLFLFESRRQHGDNAEIRMSRGFRDFEALILNVVERGQRDGSFTQGLDAPAMASALLGCAEGMVRDRMLSAMLGRLVPFSETQLRMTFEAMMRGLAP